MFPRPGRPPCRSVYDESLTASKAKTTKTIDTINDTLYSSRRITTIFSAEPHNRLPIRTKRRRRNPTPPRNRRRPLPDIRLFVRVPIIDIYIYFFILVHSIFFLVRRYVNVNNCFQYVNGEFFPTYDCASIITITCGLYIMNGNPTLLNLYFRYQFTFDAFIRYVIRLRV